MDRGANAANCEDVTDFFTPPSLKRIIEICTKPNGSSFISASIERLEGRPGFPSSSLPLKGLRTRVVPAGGRTADRRSPLLPRHRDVCRRGPGRRRGGSRRRPRPARRSVCRRPAPASAAKGPRPGRCSRYVGKRTSREKIFVKEGPTSGPVTETRGRTDGRFIVASGPSTRTRSHGVFTVSRGTAWLRLRQAKRGDGAPASGPTMWPGTQ